MQKTHDYTAYFLIFGGRLTYCTKYIIMNKLGLCLLTLGFLFTFTPYISAQELTKKEKKELKKILKTADEEYDTEYYPQALEKYKEAYDLDPNSAYINFRIGMCYENGVDKHKALEYIKKAYDKQPDIDDNILLYLADAYHFHEDFDEAISYYNKYKKQIDKKDKDLLKQVNRHIYECNNGKEFMANPIDVKIVHLGNVVNSKYQDYSPVISADEKTLVFTSLREGSTGGNLDDRGMYFEDIYITHKVDGEWTTPQNITTINTDLHEATVGLSPDGENLIIYKHKGGGDIFYCRLNKDGEWVKPKPFPSQISNKNSYEPSAIISNDGTKLYFVSDREGGYGGLDIYVVEMDKKGKWGDPKNLGPTINSEYDEDAPFLDIDGKTLYFSSQGHKGMGLDDIFKSEYENGKWSTPENLGYPINTVGRNPYFVLSGDGKSAYFSTSGEESVGGQDLYRIEMPQADDYEERLELLAEITGEEIKPEPVIKKEVIPEPEIVDEVILSEVILEVTVVDAATNQPLEATVELVNKETGEKILTSTALNGLFEMEFKESEAKTFSIYAEMDGYVYKTTDIIIPPMDVDLQKVIKTIPLQKVEEEVNVVHILRNIYFDFDLHTLKSQSFVELDKLKDMLEKSPELNVEIAGHTDIIGSPAYNMSLSHKRASAVVNYLVRKGISRSRISTKGYGETKPLASNDDEAEGRELNRRTEFILLKD